MSSSSAVQTAFVFAAIATQAGAFAPTRALPVFKGISTSSSSFSNVRSTPLPISRRQGNELSMAWNIGRKGEKKIESTSLQASTAALDEIPKSTSKNPLTRWVESVAWPSKKELKKLLPLGAMLFFILFNYTILRDTKVLFFFKLSKIHFNVREIFSNDA